MSDKRLPKEVSRMVSGGALLLNVLVKLIKALFANGVSAEEIRALDTPAGEGTVDRMAGWMVAGMRADANSSVPPSDWWVQYFAMLLGMCRFRHGCIASGEPKLWLTGTDFPFKPEYLHPGEVKLVSTDVLMSDEEALAYLKQQGYRPANVVETLVWWITKCSLPPTETIEVVALGSRRECDGSYLTVSHSVWSTEGEMRTANRGRPKSGEMKWERGIKFAAVWVGKPNEEVVS